MGPLLEVLRPISPLAWIPISILWFGVGDLAAVFIIFLASFLPLAMAASHAVRNISAVHLQAGRNFRLPPADLVRKVVLPAVLPQLLVALRLALGIAWLVVVAAEMIAVNSGLGFLIVDARNAGNRYDLVVAGMVLIGLVGLALDAAIRRLERLPGLRWGYAEAQRMMPVPRPDARPVKVRIAGLSMTFEADGKRVEVLRDIDLEVREGELVCLLGPSGCGKSTLLNLVGGFLRPTAGLDRDRRRGGRAGPTRAASSSSRSAASSPGSPSKATSASASGACRPPSAPSASATTSSWSASRGSRAPTRTSSRAA